MSGIDQSFYERNKRIINRISDLLLVAGILFIVNFFLVSDDLGWMNVNPNPYYLLPILLGSRYGFSVGCFAGFVAVAMLLLMIEFGHGLSAGLYMETHSYQIFSFIAVGSICGQVCGYMSKRFQQIETKNEGLMRRVSKLDRDYKTVEQINDQLQRKLVIRDNKGFNMDLEIRLLYECEVRDLYQSVLFTVNRLNRISDAAMFIFKKDDKHMLERSAALGDFSLFPTEMTDTDLPMVEMALKRKEMVTIPEVLEDTVDVEEPYLFALPFLGGDGKCICVLLVANMPFIEFRPASLKNIKLVSSWVSEVIELRTGESKKHYKLIEGYNEKRIFFEKYFKHNLKLSVRFYHEQHLPSSIVILEYPAENDISQNDLEIALAPMFRTGDLPTVLPRKFPHVAILLPFSGDRGAILCQQRCARYFQSKFKDLMPLKTKIYRMSDASNFNSLWTYLCENELDDEKAKIEKIRALQKPLFEI